MKIGIIGAGAIGSLVAGLLTKAGEDVFLAGRQDHMSAIKKKGLLIKSADSTQTVKVPGGVKLQAPCDLVIFTVKTQDLEQAYQDNHEFLEPGEGLILTAQNGVQADNLLSFHFDLPQMISSIVMFGATYTRPGEVVYNFPGDWIIGKPFGPNDPQVEVLAVILRKAFPVVISANIMGMKWLKLFINFNNCIPALLGRCMQETFCDKDFCRLSVLLLKEGVKVVRAAGIEMLSLPQFPVERIQALSTMPVEDAAQIMHKTLTALSREPLYGSILQSIMRKKPSEIDFINGEVIPLARNIRMTTPLNGKIVDMVHEVENTGKFFTPDEIKKAFNL